MDKVKAKVLDELIKLMDMEDGEQLKKHPKLMAAKITIAKPMGEGEGEGMMKGKMHDEMMKEMMPEEESDMEDEGEMEAPETEEFEKLPMEMQAKILKKLMK